MNLYIVGSNYIDSESLGEYYTTLIVASSEEEALSIAATHKVYHRAKAVKVDLSTARILIEAVEEPDWASNLE